MHNKKSSKQKKLTPVENLIKGILESADIYYHKTLSESIQRGIKNKRLRGNK